LFRLSGLSPDELRGEHSAIGRLVYYRKMGKRESSLTSIPVYLGASFEAGNVWQDSDDISFSDLRYSSSVFVVLESAIGPLEIAYGLSDGGRD